MRRLLEVVALATVGAVPALLMGMRDLGSPPKWSLRTNVSGRSVPAILGRAVVCGGVVALLAVAAGSAAGWIASPGRVGVAAAVVLVSLGGAGAWDDSRGDEAPRGFAGHLRAGRVTGGLAKIAAGGLAGICAAALLYADDAVMAVLTALAIPLTANLLNLLDRAPGRAGKVALLIGVPALALGSHRWALSAAGTLGALTALLPSDLGERGMLGDAGANPVGGLLGLGLAVSLEAAPLAGVVAVLVLLNAASERWSFSRAIERTPLLRALDAIGRK